MKNILQKAGSRVGIAALVCAAAFFTVLAGCSSPLDHNEPAPAGMGTVLLTLDSPGLVRTTLPGDPPGGVAFDDYELTFAPQPSGAAINLSWDGAASLFVPVGDYILSVLAFAGTGDDREQVAQGTSEQFTVSEHGPNAVSVLLFPVGGAGTFEWNLTVPDGITAAGLQVFVYTADGAAETAYWTSEPLAPVGNTIAGERGLPANRYLAVFTLTRGAETATIAEIVHVFRDRTSLFTETVTDIRFPSSLLAFIAGAWNGTDFGDSGVTHAHFAPPRGLAVQGVTSGNFDNLVEQFAYLLEEYFPTTIYGVRALIDAALIADNTGPAFAIAEDFATRAEAESEIADFAPNTPDDALYFAWEPDAGDEVEAGDTVTVRVGDADGYSFEVMITFIGDTRTPVASVVISGNYAVPIDILAAPVTLQLSAVAYDTGGADIFDEWVFAWRATSIPEGAITVDNDGLVTAHFAGADGTATATIIATTGNPAMDSLGVTVTARQRATGITITPNEDVTVVHEETRTLTATVIPANAIVEDRTVVWTIDGTGVSIEGAETGATVTVRGDALDAVATVVATIDGTAVSAEVEVRVVAPPAFTLTRRTDWLGNNSGNRGRIQAVTYNVGDLTITGIGRFVGGEGGGAGTIYTPIIGDFVAEIEMVHHAGHDNNNNLAGLWLISTPSVNNDQYAIAFGGRTFRTNNNNARRITTQARGFVNTTVAPVFGNPTGAPWIRDVPGSAAIAANSSIWRIRFERNGVDFTTTVTATNTADSEVTHSSTFTADYFNSATETYWLGMVVSGGNNDSGNEATATASSATFRNFYITQNGTRSRVNLNQPGIADAPPTVTSVTIEGPTPLTVGAGQEITLTANVQPATLPDRTVTWNVNPASAVVESDGTTVTIRGGEVGDTITVTATSVALNANDAPVPATVTVNVVSAMVWTQVASLTFANGTPFAAAAALAGVVRANSAISTNISFTLGEENEVPVSVGNTGGGAYQWRTDAAQGLQTGGATSSNIIQLSNLPRPFRIRVSFGDNGGSNTPGRFVTFNGIDSDDGTPGNTTNALWTQRDFLGDDNLTVQIGNRGGAIRFHEVQVYFGTQP